MLALILHFEATPMHIGSSRFCRWTLFAGITMRPRATSEPINSGSRSSRLATNAISGVTIPLRAASSWVMASAFGLAAEESGLEGIAFLRRHYPDQVQRV